MPDTNDILSGEGSHDLSILFEQAGAMPDDIEWHDHPEETAVGTVSLRHDYSVQIVDLEQYMPTPRRAKSMVRLSDTQSFIDYLTRFRFVTPDTVVYVGRDAATAEAIFNDHGSEPGWRDQRALLVWGKTDEWKRWTKHDRTLMKQEEFAELIEDGLSEIIEPDAADLLEIAQTVKALMTVNVTSARYLRDGTVKIGWDETVDAQAGRSGDMEIPSHFTLQLAPFEGGTPITITARLRYRLVNKMLTFGYILDRPKDQEKIALDAEISLIRADVPDVFMVMGNPGA